LDINEGIIMDDYRQWSHKEVWEKVCAFARHAQATGQPIDTLTRGERNTIIQVTPTKIIRDSEGATSGTNQVTRSNVLDVWDALMQDGVSGDEAVAVPYFTYALMKAAFPDLIKRIGTGSQIALKRRSESGPA
jgi:hypothetical protein